MRARRRQFAYVTGMVEVGQCDVCGIYTRNISAQKGHEPRNVLKPNEWRDIHGVFVSEQNPCF
jgi:hypothetical protein